VGEDTVNGGDFLLGVGASVVAAGVLAAVEYFRKAPLIKSFQVGYRARTSGIVNIFPERGDYLRLRPDGDIASYISTAQQSLTYVGFGLGHGVQFSEVTKALHGLIAKRVRVCLVLLDPTIDAPYVDRLARYFSTTAEAQRRLIEESWAEFRRLRAGLSVSEQAFLELRAHKELLTSSAFIFDAGSATAKTLVDFKIYARGRDKSFGIEFSGTARAASLFERMTQSFETVRDIATAMT